MQYVEAYNLIDLFIVVTLVVTGILGIWKGFLRSLTALASIVIGVVLAMKYYPAVQPYLGKISSLDPTISTAISMAIIFIAVQVVFLLVRRVLDALIDVTRLGWLDRTLGAGIGLAAGFLIVVAVVEAALLGIPDWPVVKESKLVQPVDDIARRGLRFAPQQVRDQIQSLTEQWKGTQGTTPPEAGSQAVPSKSKDSSPPKATR